MAAMAALGGRRGTRRGLVPSGPRATVDAVSAVVAVCGISVWPSVIAVVVVRSSRAGIVTLCNPEGRVGHACGELLTRTGAA